MLSVHMEPFVIWMTAMVVRSVTVMSRVMVMNVPREPNARLSSTVSKMDPLDTGTYTI